MAHLEQVALITITAPGVGVLPWDAARCAHRGPHKHSGPSGCRVVEAAADRWNDLSEGQLAKLHRAASERVRRKHGGGPIKAAQSVEQHQRGVNHFHLVVDYSPRERRRIDAYVEALNELAPRYMFGRSQLAKPYNENGGVRAANYLVKYVTKAAGNEELRARRPMMVGRHLTTRTGYTMRHCRWKRYAWHWNQRASDRERQELVDKTLRLLAAGVPIAIANQTVWADHFALPPPEQAAPSAA